MTREEAIRLIGWLKCTTNREDDLKAIDMAIEALSAEVVSREEYEEVKEEYINTVGAILAVISAPSCLKEVNDLIEPLKVVRCKDCIHWQRTNIETIDGEPIYDCPFCGEWADANGFCSFGERREE